MLYSYRNGSTYCKCRCECGNTTIVCASNLKSGKTKSCGCLERESRYGRQHGKYSAGDVVNGFTLLEETEMRTSSKSIIWKCRCICGNIIFDAPSNIIHSNKKQCRDCYTHPLLIDLTGNKYGMLTVIAQSPYRIWSGKRVAWICKCDCGKEVVASSDGLRSGQITSCGCKSKSIKIQYIKEILDDMGIEHTTEHRFEDCKDKRTLPFDIYIPSCKTVIEYDGRQHFEAVKFWGGEDGLLTRKYHDRIKNEYCLRNNINIIRIPYFMTDKEIRNKIDELEPVTSKRYAERSA